MSDTRLSMHAAGRRCPDRPAASYQTRRGQPGKLPLALAWDVELLHSPLDLNGSAIVVGAGRPAAGSVLLERPAALKATELRLTGLSYE